VIFYNPAGAPVLACDECGCRWFDRMSGNCYECGAPVSAAAREEYERALAGARGTQAMQFRLYWEDFRPGSVFEHGSVSLSQQDIIGFARQWDPQRYHTDPEAAKHTPFGGLIASGWQSCGVAMRLMCEAYLNESSCIGSPGIDEIRFLKPVRPGDVLRFRSTVLESAPSRTRAERGNVTFRWELLNQRDEVVLSMLGRQLYLKRRP
jgi:acyl dehydratase